MKDDCIFCKLSHDPKVVIWENAAFAAIKDIHPEDDVHVLVLAKRHLDNLDQVTPDLAPDLVAAIQEVARQQGVAGRYRIGVNVGLEGGQEIGHLHVHVLASAKPS